MLNNRYQQGISGERQPLRAVPVEALGRVVLTNGSAFDSKKLDPAYVNRRVNNVDKAHYMANVIERYRNNFNIDGLNMISRRAERHYYYAKYDRENITKEPIRTAIEKTNIGAMIDFSGQVIFDYEKHNESLTPNQTMLKAVTEFYDKIKNDDIDESHLGVFAYDKSGKASYEIDFAHNQLRFTKKAIDTNKKFVEEWLLEPWKASTVGPSLTKRAGAYGGITYHVTESSMANNRGGFDFVASDSTKTRFGATNDEAEAFVAILRDIEFADVQRESV